MSAEPEPRVVDVIAATIGYDRPREGLIGSGLSRILAYNQAGDIVRALGLPIDLRASVLRRWGAGEVIHLVPVQHSSAGDDCSPRGLPRPELGLTADGADLARAEHRHDVAMGRYFEDGAS